MGILASARVSFKWNTSKRVVIHPVFVGSVSLSVIVTALFNKSRGSILIPAFFHFQVNNPIWPDAQPNDTLAFAAAAIIVVWINLKAMFSKDDAVTKVIPQNESPGNL